MKRHSILLITGAFLIFVTWLFFANALDPGRAGREAALIFDGAVKMSESGRYVEAIEEFRKVTDTSRFGEEAWFRMAEAAMQLDDSAYPVENAVNYYNNAYNCNRANPRNLIRKAEACRKLAAAQKAKQWEFDSSYEKALECYDMAFALKSGEVELAYEISSFLYNILLEENKARFRYARFVRLSEYIAKVEKLKPGFKDIAGIKSDLASKFPERRSGDLGVVVEKSIVDKDSATAYLVTVISLHNYASAAVEFDKSRVSLLIAGAGGAEIKHADPAGCKSDMKKGNHFIVSGFEMAPILDKVKMAPGGSARAGLFFELPGNDGLVGKDAELFLNISAAPETSGAGLKIRLRLDE